MNDNCGKNYFNDLTKDAFMKQIDSETIKILSKEKKRIIDSYIGYTTWGKIKELFPEILFKTKKEICELNN